MGIFEKYANFDHRIVKEGLQNCLSDLLLSRLSHWLLNHVPWKDNKVMQVISFNCTEKPSCARCKHKRNYTGSFSVYGKCCCDREKSTRILFFIRTPCNLVFESAFLVHRRYVNRSFEISIFHIKCKNYYIRKVSPYIEPRRSIEETLHLIRTRTFSTYAKSHDESRFLQSFWIFLSLTTKHEKSPRIKKRFPNFPPIYLESSLRNVNRASFKIKVRVMNFPSIIN